MAARSKAWGFGCWDCRFDFRWGHRSEFLVSVVCCICDGPIARPEESYRVCACMCVIECSQVQH